MTENNTKVKELENTIVEMSKQINLLKNIVTELCATLKDKTQQEKVQKQLDNLTNNNHENSIEMIEQNASETINQTSTDKENKSNDKKQAKESNGKRKERNGGGGYKLNDKDLTGKVGNYFEVATESEMRKKNRTESSNNQDE